MLVLPQLAQNFKVAHHLSPLQMPTAACFITVHAWLYLPIASVPPEEQTASIPLTQTQNTPEHQRGFSSSATATSLPNHVLSILRRILKSLLPK